MFELLKKLLAGIVIAPIVVIVIPVILWVLLLSAVVKTYIRLRLRFEWPSTTFILFTYSDSDNWAGYIEQNILPRISDYSKIINRSVQQDWKSSYRTERRALETWVNLSINPVAIIYRPWRPAKVIQFYEAFRELKHGKSSAINAKCEELFQCLPMNP